MEMRIEKHITSKIGRLRLKSVKPLQCQEILNAQRGMSKSHIKKVHQELQFIFEKAKENRLVLDNPADHLIRPEGYQNKRRSITDHERRHLLSVCEKDPCYLFFLLMLYCGCRPGEAAIVRRSDLIEIKGVWFLHIRGTKTANSDRAVPVVPELLPKLLALEPFALAAPNRAGRQHSESSYDRLVAHLKRDLNISMGCRVYRSQLVPPYPLADDFVPYMLRHTFCTDLQKKGVDIRAAQKLMGHADIQTTANIYTHQDDDTLLQAAVLMGAGVSGATVGATSK
jgi:integrase